MATALQLHAAILAMSPQQLKALRDNPKLPYSVRQAAGNLLNAQQVDGVRVGYMR